MDQSSQPTKSAAQTPAANPFRPHYKTRDLMAILALSLIIFVTGYIFKPMEAVLMGVGISGWWVSGFMWGLFNFAAVIATYKVRKFGVATLTILIGFLIRILLGSPGANTLPFYALAWGIPADLILTAFRQKRSLVVYLIAWGVAGIPVFWITDYIFFREVYMGFLDKYGPIAFSGIHRVVGGLSGAIVGWVFAKALDRIGLMD